MEHQYSKRAVWLAANDDVHGPRLVEIARAHSKLALKASDQLRAREGVEQVQGTLNEIKRLRVERNAIILLFEEGGTQYEVNNDLSVFSGE